MASTKRAFNPILGAAALALLSLGGGAYAQDTTESEEIVVTAQKREGALFDTPFSVNAMSEEDMRNRGVLSLEDLSRNVASFQVQNLGPGQSQVAIRGVSAGQIARDLPGVKEQVGVYLDESVISLSLFTPELDLYDLNRIEVLRGPQGTLFGSGSLAGTVRYITNQPLVGVYEASLEATVSNVEDGEWGGDLRGMINIPVTDQAALRIVAYASELPGFIDAVQPGGSVNEDVNGGERRGVRASFRLEATPDLAITPRVLWQITEVGGFNRVDRFNILANPYTTTRPQVTLGDLQQFTQFEERFEDELRLFDLTVEWGLGDVNLTSISTVSSRDVLVYRDATQLTGSITGQAGVFTPAGLPENVYTLDAPLIDRTELETFTQEVRLASNSDTAFDWVIGAFYSDIDRDYAQTLPVIGFTALTGIPTAGVRAPEDFLYYSTVPYELTQYALFGEATWDFAPQWALTAGVRWSRYEEDRILTFDGVFAVQTIDVPGSVEDDDVSPRVILSWEPSDDLRFNVQASRGFRLGGINDPLNEPLCSTDDFNTFNAIRNDQFESESVWNYEAGMRKRLMNGAATFSFAAFYSDIEDLQTTVDAGSCSSRIIVNVPEARSVGAEAEFSWTISENFDFAVSASYSDSQLTSSILDVNGDVVQGLRDGNRLPTVPEFQAAVSLTYTQPMFDTFDGFATVTAQYVGDRFTQVSDQEANPRTATLIPQIGAPSVATLSFPLDLEEYTLVNLRFGLRNDEWEAALFVNNATDEEAELAIDRERGLRARYGVLVNPPRTIGLTLRKSF